MSLRQRRVELDGVTKQPLCLEIVLRARLVETLRPEMEEVPCAQGVGRFLLDARALGTADLRLDPRGDGRHDLVLQIEDLSEIAIVAFAPYTATGFRLGKPRSDPHAPTRPSDTALHDVVGAELCTEATHIDRLSLERERRATRDYQERAMLGQRGDDVF